MRESPSNLIPSEMSPGPLAALIGSPLTPKAEIIFSTPHDPSQRRALIDCSDTNTSFEEAGEVDCYNLDGDKLSYVNESEFKHFKISLDEDIGPEKCCRVGIIKIRVID